jgi:hypothetical protein
MGVQLGFMGVQLGGKSSGRELSQQREAVAALP